MENNKRKENMTKNRLNEISSKVLKSYMDKAHDDHANKSFQRSYNRLGYKKNQDDGSLDRSISNRSKGLDLAKKKYSAKTGKSIKSADEHIRDYKKTKERDVYQHPDGSKYHVDYSKRVAPVTHTDKTGKKRVYKDFNDFHKNVSSFHENVSLTTNNLNGNKVTDIQHQNYKESFPMNNKIKTIVEEQIKKRGRGRPKKEEGDGGDNHPEMQLRKIASMGGGSFNHKDGSTTKLSRDKAVFLMNIANKNEKTSDRLDAYKHLHKSSENMAASLNNKSITPEPKKSRKTITLPRIRALGN